MCRKTLFCLPALLVLCLSIISGCGGGGTTVSVHISPETATLAPGGQLQFEASVTGTSNTKVSWSVSPSGGGSITNDGLYTAPLSEGVYYVKATSVANPSKYAQATVTVIDGGGGDTDVIYQGTITIDNAGTADELIMDQEANISGIKLVAAEPEPGKDYQYFYSICGTYPAIVNASVNDQAGTDPVMTITGSLTNASMVPPQIAIYLGFKETTYDLFVGIGPFTCTYTSPEITIQDFYAILGRFIENRPLPADRSHITGSLTLPVQDAALSGIIQTIT